MSDDVGAESVAAMSADGAKPRCVDGIHDGAWTHTRQLDFGREAPSELWLSLRVKIPTCSPGDCPRLTLHLDTLEAAASASCELNSTSGRWATVSCPIGGASKGSRQQLQGVHDLFRVTLAPADPWTRISYCFIR